MLFSFDETILLSELERRPTLLELSKKIGKDISVISRDLKRISEKAPVIEKINGRWVLTKKGLALAHWCRKLVAEESEILNKDHMLTIATTREFAARILAPNLESLGIPNIRVNILTCEKGVENALLNGLADFGLDCGKPQDPAIAFRQIIEEKIVTVMSKDLYKKKIKSAANLDEKDLIFYERISPLRNVDVSRSRAISNDIAVVRSLLVHSKGWSTLPYYSVKNELREKQLFLVPGGEIKGYKFGVWWPRGRDSLLPWIKKTEFWLARQDLII